MLKFMFVMLFLVVLGMFVGLAFLFLPSEVLHKFEDWLKKRKSGEEEK